MKEELGDRAFPSILHHFAISDTLQTQPGLLHKKHKNLRTAKSRHSRNISYQIKTRNDKFITQEKTVAFDQRRPVEEAGTSPR